jgi:Domain of unknown function (DUF4167)
MRQNQQNRRMRGRGNGGGGGNNNNNNNRRGPNPLTRSYESNGPDVKVRGTAQNIADKYLQLARDSHSSGDRVMAENYLQHAEHYNRLIATAMAQQQQQFQGERRDEDEEDLNEGGDNRFADNRIARNEQDQPEQGNGAYDGEQPQPVMEAQPVAAQSAEAAPVQREGRPQREPREARPPREPREARPPIEPREARAPEEGSTDRAEDFRARRRERAPRPPREPRVPVDADGEQPDAGGLLATLSRGADKPVPVVAED